MAFVEYQKKGHIVTITLNRPDRLNALGKEVTDEIVAACKKVDGDPEARAAIITGAGRAFCAGNDVREMHEVGGPPNPIHAAYVVAEVTKPVIAAVNGFALGGGCWIAIACDIRIAAKNATFGMPEIKVAIPLGPERFLIQQIPLCIINEIIFLGERITAQRAYEVGLINKVVDEKDLMDEAVKTAEKIAELSPWAVQVNKKAKIKASSLNKETFDEEQHRRIIARQADDFKEAVKAFAEKRKPVFK
ncbi:MAG: enoyl-CoA hydratase-related protein [Deltaproteobacteria bacterium]